MNKWYLVIVQEFVDKSQPTAKAIFEFESRDEALVRYYNELSYAISGTTVQTLMIEILDRFGNDDHKEYWERFDQQEV